MKSLAQKIRRKIVVGSKYANVRGLVFFAQRRLQKPRARRHLARLVARFLPSPSAAARTLTSEAAKLHSQGFAPIDGLVTPAMANEMRDYLAQQPVYPPYILDAPLTSIDAPQLPDSHTLVIPEKFIVSCPYLLDLANDPRILAAVEGVFGCKPTLGYIVAWWSVPTADGKPRQAENFHRDVDDVHFLKLFIYLTDVESENGPHEYIQGSHDLPQLGDIDRHSDEEVLQAFGADRLVRFTGPAGTVFLENTYGLHRGQPVRAGRRLILQFIYSMLPMAYGPAMPYRRELFAPAQIAIDPYVNRAYVGQP
jgi:hypothetical protein